jgi:colanic acid/amylovoran biosynthesis glycosyltransferase
MSSVSLEGPAGRVGLAVLFSRFPVWNQMFPLGDLMALAAAGFELHIFTLRGRWGSIEQEEAQAFTRCLHRAPLASWTMLREVAMAFRRPATWRLFLKVVASASPRPAEVVKSLVLFPQAVYFARLARQHGIRHLHAEWASYPATAAWIASELTGIPFSFSAHAYDIYMTQTLLREKLLRARFVATCANVNREALVGIGGAEVAETVHVHRHGVDLTRFRPDGRRPAASPAPPLRILTCGTMYPYKGFGHLVAACRILLERGHRFTCTIVGEGPERRRLERQIKQGGLGEHVRLVPPMTQVELSRQYREATLFVLASVVTRDGNRDVIPNVLVEAMASGVPVVSTRLAGIQELIQDGVHGVLVPPGDSRALADAIGSLMADAGRRERLVQNARQRVVDEYDRRKNADGLIRTFRRHLVSDEVNVACS